ncbi:MAG: sulfoxide reductase heme-binding subunit YedZ [Caldilinea sp.]|nr:sulfoxide reductase heme-binding subunit YedZ [Caldilinea sp.]MDW8442505.1 protein-methionine-sulfoxide reductase heme-binding subunit MsrQ [Caldilineaceae bacterium]
MKILYAGAITFLHRGGFWWSVTLAGLTPLLWLLWRAASGGLGVDPVNTINNVTGRAALITLFLSLSCTPLSAIFGFRRALTVRKSLGLMAFLYASLHLLNFVGLDYGLNLKLIVQDALLNKPYILAGGLAFLLLLPLAITSTRGWMKRLGKRWKQLHRLVYVVGVLAVLHFFWQAKVAERWEPMAYAVLLALLLLVRIPQIRRKLSVRSPKAVNMAARADRTLQQFE